MTATTLGDLFPQLNNCRPPKTDRKAQPKRRTGPGTAERLKTLYPELDGWDSLCVTSAWLHWGKTCGIELNEPRKRDERFMVFLASFIHEKMLELESMSRSAARKPNPIDDAFRQLELSSGSPA